MFVSCITVHGTLLFLVISDVKSQFVVWIFFFIPYMDGKMLCLLSFIIHKVLSCMHVCQQLEKKAPKGAPHVFRQA